MVDVHIEGISKSFEGGNVVALDNINFDVSKGELFGLIGPDGAGKSTLFRILTTLILPDQGIAQVSGNDIVMDYKEIRKSVGYMPGKFSLYQDLTVEENLKFFATVFNTTVAENYDLIKDIYVQIEPFKTRRAGKLSGGMKQKLALCCALIHRPSVLFLDEPTTGVDAVSRKEFWNMLKMLKNEGITILVSTPYMDEATLCERIALIQKGKILSVDTPEKIIQAFDKPLYAVRAENMTDLLYELRKIPGITSCNAFGEYHHITIEDKQEKAVQIALQQAGHKELEIKLIQPTIEDCFINLLS